MFGLLPGRIPAFLHEAYEHAEGRQRVELAIAIAKAWGYGYQPERARRFAVEAITSDEAVNDPALKAAALDALLVVSWGPDDLDERLRITSQLEDTAAHLSDVEVQMSSYLWRLTTALECLDVPAMRRQLRNLERLAEDSGSLRVRFFAEARRGMHALLVGDLDEARRAHAAATAAGYQAGEPDAFAIDNELKGEIARHTGDVTQLTDLATLFVEFGQREGLDSVAAEGARLWLASGDVDRAATVMHQIAGADFSRIPRDLDWLLTITVLAEVAAGTGAQELSRVAIELLTPYAGRGVPNGGAVTFGGVVDHYLALACAVTGDTAAAERWWASAAQAYDRVGAVWWANRCRSGSRSSATAGFVLRPSGDGVWQVGGGDRVATIKEMKGLSYLRLLLQHPGRDITAPELSAIVAGGRALEVVDEALLLTDAQAVAAYRKRLADIEAELDDADDRGDERRSAELIGERDALIAELRRVTGLGGRARSTGGSDERARVAVRKAIAAAISRIGEIDPRLARTLGAAVTTGAVCRYQPDPDRPISWQLS
jgi:hypothetical protein